MKKSNNKGFTLVEVVISVAVLTILVVPIVLQLSKSMKTSAAAKERQAAVENADLLLEYFQKTDLVTLSKGGTGEIDMNALTTGDTKTITCQLCDEHGNPTGYSVDYTTTDYTVAPVELGRNKTSYQQIVSLDDLNNKVMEQGYRVTTLATATNSDALPTGTDGWVVTNEGNVVKYTPDDPFDPNSPSHVTSVCVKPRKASDGVYVDPNSANLGYVQNLDSEKIAVIAGDATSIDDQFNNDVYNTVLTNALAAKEKIDAKKWAELTDKLVIHGAGGSVTYEGTMLDYNIKRVTTSSSRVMVITMTYDTVAVNPHYKVECDVFYSTTISPMTVGSTKVTDEISAVYHYGVFSQDFYTLSPPDVYLIYEPLLQSYTGVTSYVANDYIITQCDEEITANADEAGKVYLVKSSAPSLKDTAYVSGNKFLSYFNSNKEVKIHTMFKSVDSSVTAPIIYTNIATTDDGSGVYELTDTNKAAHFALDTDIPANVKDNVLFKQLTDSYSLDTAYQSNQIKALSDGERTEGRLYTVRVTLRNSETKEEIYLTGGKGAD